MKRKTFTDKEKLAYYEKRSEDKTLSEQQRIYATTYCLGVFASEELFENPKRIPSTFPVLINEKDKVVGAGFRNGFATGVNVQIDKKNKK